MKRSIHVDIFKILAIEIPFDWYLIILFVLVLAMTVCISLYNKSSVNIGIKQSCLLNKLTTALKGQGLR